MQAAEEHLLTKCTYKFQHVGLPNKIPLSVSIPNKVYHTEDLNESLKFNTSNSVFTRKVFCLTR